RRADPGRRPQRPRALSGRRRARTASRRGDPDGRLTRTAEQRMRTAVRRTEAVRAPYRCLSVGCRARSVGAEPATAERSAGALAPSRPFRGGTRAGAQIAELVRQTAAAVLRHLFRLAVLPFLAHRALGRQVRLFLG